MYILYGSYIIYDVAFMAVLSAFGKEQAAAQHNAVHHGCVDAGDREAALRLHTPGPLRTIRKAHSGDKNQLKHITQLKLY